MAVIGAAYFRPYSIERSEPITAPGIPPDFPNPESLITTDCIEPPKL